MGPALEVYQDLPFLVHPLGTFSPGQEEIVPLEFYTRGFLLIVPNKRFHRRFSVDSDKSARHGPIALFEVFCFSKVQGFTKG